MSKAAKARVLVVDDERSVLFTYRMILEQQGYAVIAAISLKEAMDALAANEFDLVLCDYSLDEQHTGFEVIRKAREKHPGVPAALLTGYATLETADQAAAEDIAVLYKPIDIQEFLSTTSSLLRKKDESQQKDDGQESAAQDSEEQRGASGDPGARTRGAAQRRSRG